MLPDFLLLLGYHFHGAARWRSVSAVLDKGHVKIKSIHCSAGKDPFNSNDCCSFLRLASRHHHSAVCDEALYGNCL